MLRFLPLLATASLLLAGCAAHKEYRLTDASDAARLSVPAHIVLVAVDERRLHDSTYVFLGRSQQLRLEPGEHRLQLRYMDMVPENDSRQADDVKRYSEPVSVKMNFAANGEYRVVAPRPDTLEAATRFAKHPRIVIKQSQTGDTVGTAAAPPASAAPAAVKTDAQGDSPTALQMLEFWWQRANAEQRRRFLERRD